MKIEHPPVSIVRRPVRISVQSFLSYAADAERVILHHLKHGGHALLHDFYVGFEDQGIFRLGQTDAHVHARPVVGGFPERADRR